MRSIAIFFFFALTPLVAEIPWWANISSCPLQLGMNENKRYMYVLNVGKEPTVQYSLGCVAPDARGYVTVGRVVKNRNVSLPENGFASDSVSVMEELQAACGAPHWRLAVVKVVLADGSVWNIGSQGRLEEIPSKAK